jgi:oligopeptide transport system ATP-binding protein
LASPLLEVDNLRTEFQTASGTVQAVRGVSFHVERGETVGIVGESGSGKSVTALSLMGLVPSPPGRIVEGSVRLDGEQLVGKPEREMRKIRGSKMAMVFQDPFSSLNPTMPLGAQVAEPIRLHTGAGRAEAREEVLRLFQAVRIPSPEIRCRQYPHQISGGQRQRVMIAIAFACNPELLIADEPTTALDVTVQAQVLTLMTEMQRKSNAGVVLITHDLGVVAEVCDRVLVMYAGMVVESGTVEQIFRAPKHPYTQGLLDSLPQIHTVRNRRLPSIAGQPPDLAHLPPGCPFYPRCPKRMPDICPTREPEPIPTEPGRTVRCYLYEEGCLPAADRDEPHH